jgi:3',5'-cyclic AMP phosphodiesterase CpdA
LYFNKEQGLRMAKNIRSIYNKVVSTLSKPLVIKRTSLARHKNPPEIRFLYEETPEIKLMASRVAAPYPNTKFYVVSDIHYYAKSLGTEGSDWEKVAGRDRKLFAESDEIVSELVKDINRHRCDFVLITGDMTKDGERLCHEKLIEHLNKIKKPVYVVPGNHDILNPDACSFHGRKEAVPTIDHNEFLELYHNFGYSRAVSRDPASLSYMVEIKKDLCLLALDTTWPVTKIPNELIVDGKLSESSWRWAEEQLIWAKSNNKAVFAALHHPFLEHWQGQISFMPEYIIENHRRLVDLFLTYSVRVGFVGHFHAQDVSMYQGKWRRLYQIMTGSPISYPCSYRRMAFQNNRLIGLTFHIKRIPSYPNSLIFNNYARRKLRQAVRENTEKPLKLMGVKKADREKIIESGADAFQANYAGNEKAAGRSYQPILPPKNQLGFMGRLALKALGYVIEGMWADDSLFGDNNFELPLGN